MNNEDFNDIVPVAGQVYQHYKGNFYKVISIATHTETEEEIVIYHLDGDNSKLWARPMKNFTGYVNNGDCNECWQSYIKRFSLIQDVSNIFTEPNKHFAECTLCGTKVECDEYGLWVEYHDCKNNPFG
jgi:hypothetical protein